MCPFIKYTQTIILLLLIHFLFFSPVAISGLHCHFIRLSVVPSLATSIVFIFACTETVKNYLSTKCLGSLIIFFFLSLLAFKAFLRLQKFRN